MVRGWKRNTAVITSVVGGYDHPSSHNYMDGVDYILFTDGSYKPTSDRWRVEMLDNPRGLSNRRLAKLPKVNPFQFEVLSKYKYVIWIDGSLEILKPKFPLEILSYLKKGWVASPHFDDRHCAYGEAAICFGNHPKYKKEPLEEQCDNYRTIGFPENYGLYECGISARDMTKSGVRELCAHWSNEIDQWSTQDQVSFPFSLWSTGVEIDVLPKSFRDYGWVRVNAHKRED